MGEIYHKGRAGFAVSPHATAYAPAVAAMEARVQAVADGRAGELLWFLEHPPLYTAGTSARPEELLEARFPVHATGRGGRFTYHGPGQRVAYAVMDLRCRGQDLRAYVAALERWLEEALAALGVEAAPRPGRVGLWVERKGADGALREEKIAAIGVRVRRWVAFHGVSLNVAPDLSHFEGIVPCGLEGYGIASLKSLKVPSGMAQADEALKSAFARVFEVSLEEEEPPPTS